MKGLISRLARITLLLLTLLVQHNVYADESSVYVVAHTSANIAKLSSAQLRKIISMRQTVWPNGQPIVVYILDPQSPVHQRLCKNYLKMFPYQIERLWEKLAYSGLGEKPIVVENEQEMLELIANTPGAIGYVSNSSDLTALHKIIEVED